MLTSDLRPHQRIHKVERKVLLEFRQQLLMHPRLPNCRLPSPNYVEGLKIKVVVMKLLFTLTTVAN